MSEKRQYWSKMNHAEVKAAAEMMSDEELGRWLRGWVHGATGSEDAVECERMEFRLGLSVGKVSHQDAEEFSRKQSERVSKRYTVATAVDSVEEKLPDTTEATGEYHLGLPDLPINKQTNKQTNNNLSAKADEIYRAYPKHVAKEAALKAISKALKVIGFDELLQAVKDFSQAVAGSDKDLLPHPATWFNGGCWQDDRTTWKPRQRFGARQMPQAQQPMTYTTGELDGIDPELLARL